MVVKLYGTRVIWWMITLIAWSGALGALVGAILWALAQWSVRAGLPLAGLSVALVLLGWTSLSVAVAERRWREGRSRLRRKRPPDDGGGTGIRV